MGLPAVRAIADIAELTGQHRAAVLVMYLEPPVARALLSQLSSHELRDIGRAMADIELIEPNVIEQVVSEFVRDLSKTAIVPKPGKTFALNDYPELINEERREGLATALRREISTEFQEFIATRPALTVATLLQDEHPQVQAVALLLMGPDNAARVLAKIDEQDRYEISMRMARITNIPTEMADDVERMLRQTLENDGSERWQIAGLDTAAQILGRLGRTVQEPLLGRIAAEDRDLSETLRRRMIRFEDLTSLDDRGIQALLKSVDRQTLLSALKNADPGLRELFLKNMSSRAAQDLREELELMSAVPRAMSRSAGEQIVQVALKLQEEGVLRLFTASDSEDE